MAVQGYDYPVHIHLELLGGCGNYPEVCLMGNQPVEIFLPEAGLLHGIDNQAALVVRVIRPAAYRIPEGKKSAVGSVARDLGEEYAGLIVSLDNGRAGAVAEKDDG